MGIFLRGFKRFDQGPRREVEEEIDLDLNSLSIKFKTVHITAEQILAMDDNDPSTWPNILPVLTDRQYYVIHSAIIHYRAGENPYDKDTSFALSNDTDFQQWSTGLAVPLTNSTDIYSFSGGNVPTPNPWDAETLEGQGVWLYSPDTPFADGDGSLSIRVWYSIIDGAP